jgi:Ca2+-binding EF-hand superfamily protein
MEAEKGGSKLATVLGVLMTRGQTRLPETQEISGMKRESFTTGGVCLFLGAVLNLAALASDEKPPRPQEKALRFSPAQILERLDRNQNGYLERSECPERLIPMYERLDANKDGKLSPEELQQLGNLLSERRGGNPPVPGSPERSSADLLFRLLDVNGDGKLSQEELQNAPKLLDRLDRNKNGLLELEELPAAGRPGGRPGEIITPAAKGERHKDTLRLGDPAPDFTLPDPKGTREVTLSSFRGHKPVVLIFGSFT